MSEKLNTGFKRENGRFATFFTDRSDDIHLLPDGMIYISREGGDVLNTDGEGLRR